MSVTAIAGAVVAGLFAVILFLVKMVSGKSGEAAKAKAETQAQVVVDAAAVAKADTMVKQVENQSEIEHRLNTDPAYRNVVRDEFSRD